MATTYSLFDFLKDHKLTKTEKVSKGFTHVSFGHPYGSYYIDKDESNIFFELYDKALQEGKELHLIERHNLFSPMVIDIDEKYSLDTSLSM